MAEYYAIAYVIGSISAKKAIELSGLNYVDFARLVQEKAMERDLPVFQAYLKDEEVETQLPFSREIPLRHKNIMAEEYE